MTKARGGRYWQNLGCFLVIALMLAAVGLAAGISWRHADTFLHPRRHFPVETPADRGLVYRDVSFLSTDGLILQGWSIPSQNGAAIIAGHGIGGHRFLDPVEVLARQGYGVLSFDCRAHGHSEGELCTFGYHEVRDVEGALAWLQAQPDVDSARIGILGESMGAVTAIRAAAKLPGLRAVVADSPFPDLEESTGRFWRSSGLPAFPFVPLMIAFGERHTGLQLDLMEPLTEVAEISPRPILILAGGQDPITGPDAGQRYYAAAGEPKDLWFDPDVGHVSFLKSYPDEYERRVVSFFDAALLTD